MAGTLRAYGLALASAAAICAIALPTAAGIGLPGSAAPLPLVEDDAQTTPARSGDAPLDSKQRGDDPAPSLHELVQRVGALQDIRLTGELRCLAGAIYQEARGESVEGQLAVAQVILNRAESRHWPDNLCGVIYQAGQFSYTFDGRPDYPRTYSAPWRRAEAVAIVASTGIWRDVTSNAVYFHAAHVNPGWKSSKELTRRIGQHIFYR